ncbi:MAG: succinate--CoA ligase subunit beta [Elusimicrobia bacterium RIFCSPLOWO2_12_FULL_59_9]|nr:MAG: succinate--CoA ligase subunit beta [Elusimicrobia bacterium RIFCSPLOWO2_12_FULL_59_9]
MKLLEFESKRLLKEYGVPVPLSAGVFSSAPEAAAAIKKAGPGPWVLKAQVFAGGRGKAGGIQTARTAEEAGSLAQKMIGMSLTTHQTAGRGVVVNEILAEAAVKIDKEYYLSVVMDRKRGCPLMIASKEGGMEIENVARDKPQAILTELLDPVAGLEAFQARRLAFGLELAPELLSGFCSIAVSLGRLFLEQDASLVEINPLATTPDFRWIALDAKVALDDNALFRHPSVREDLDATDVERAAKKAGISYISLDGNIGCMVNGAGLAMGTMDIVKLAGGEPANFLDVGGGANVAQVREAFEILLKDPKVEAVLVNIFGGIMKCDVIAEGILKALEHVRLDVPLIVRLEGTRVEEGRKLLAQSGLPLTQAADLEDAAKKAVKAAKGESGRVVKAVK